MNEVCEVCVENYGGAIHAVFPDFADGKNRMLHHDELCLQPLGARAQSNMPMGSNMSRYVIPRTRGALMMLAKFAAKKNLGLDIDPAIKSEIVRDHEPIIMPDGLFPWQAGMIRHILDFDGSFLGTPPGSGKTRAVIDAVRIAHGSAQTGRTNVVVICPKAVIPVWPQEFAKFWPHDGDGAKPYSVLVSSEFSAEKCAREFTIMMAGRGCNIFVINYESAWREKFAKLLTGMRQLDFLIYDECHKLKTAGSRIGKFAVAMFDAAQRRQARTRIVGLSGTIIHNKPGDVYGQFRVVDPGIFGCSQERFRGRYAIMATVGYSQYGAIDVPKAWKNLEDLSHRMAAITASVAEAVVKESLPSLRAIDVPVVLPKKAMEIYREIEREGVAIIDDGMEFVTPNKVAAMIRLQQLADGFLQNDDIGVKDIHTAKHDALSELLDSLGDAPVIVVCRFTRELAAIRGIVGDVDYRELSGSRKDHIEWNAGSGRVIGVQIQAGSVGVHLYRAPYMIIFSHDFSYGNYTQMIDRMHRKGQENPCIVYHLRATGTIDTELLAPSIANKTDVANRVMKWAREKRRNYL